MIVFRLSGESRSLPADEIRALYEAYDADLDIMERADRLILVRKDLDPRILSRLAFTHEFYYVERVADMKSLDRVLLALDLKKAESFRVRCLGFEDNAAQERKSGEVIFEGRRLAVDLEGPDLTVHLIKINERVAISFDKHEIEGFNARDPNDRPFFHPLALNPKLARAMLNLARLKEGDRVLDPFCGSGSILIEAGLMGMDAFGTDRDREMLWGCRENLGYYGVEATLGEGDATDIRLEEMDAIVTDPPYARASKMFERGLDQLYSEFLASAYKALKAGGFLVLSVPQGATLAYAIVGRRGQQDTSLRQGAGRRSEGPRAGFEMVSECSMYVHKSLTRRIVVLRKKA